MAQQGSMPPWLQKKNDDSSNGGGDNEASNRLNAIERRLQARNKNKKKPAMKPGENK